MKNITTILFDFDGTIMNTNDVIIQSWQHTFHTVEGEERPLESIVRTFGEPLAVTMAKALPQITVEEGMEIYKSFLNDNYPGMIYPFPGMLELIHKLKEEQYRIGVVTSRLAESTIQGLDHFEMMPYLDCLVTWDDTEKHKPHPEPVMTALDRLSASPAEAIMLGDTMFDILCARNAGVRSVLVGWQMALTEEDIRGPEGPDFLIEKPDDLFSIL